MENIPPNESVKHEATRRGISLSQVRQERRDRPEHQPKPAPVLEIGKTYINGFGAKVKIVDCYPKDQLNLPYKYVADNGELFDERGHYSALTDVHLRKFNLIEEVPAS